MDAKSNQIVVAFKAPPDVVAWIDSVARAEGATRAGIARRFVMRARTASAVAAQQGENAA